MTLRAAIIGLLLAVLIGAFGYVNDHVLLLESVTAGTLLPISVYALLLVAVVLVNPLLSLLRGSWRFRPAELAWIVLAMLVSCSICGRGLMETFTQSISLPSYHNERSPGWQKRGLLDLTPPRLLVGSGGYDEHVIGDYYRGRGKPGKPIGLDQVPWRRWRTPLATWLPLVLLSAVASICLALIVHRQWVKREHLRYPIAEVATTLIQPGPRGGIGHVFRSRAFWIGFAVVFGIRLLGGIQMWFPDSIFVSLRIDLTSARTLLPFLRNVPWGWGLLWIMLYPTVIAFSFMLASDITLSMGLSQ